MKNKSLVYIVLILTVIIGSPQSQCLAQSNKFESNYTQVFAINVLVNGTITGLGSAIYKPKQMSFGKAFVKGFYKGCIGGAFIYSGKLLASNIYREQNLIYGWPAKITTSLGASIVENSIRHKPMFSRYGIDIGPVFLTFEKKVKIQIMPIAATMFFISLNNKVDWSASLATGSFVVSGYSNDVYHVDAYNFKSGIYYNEFKFDKYSLDYYAVISHEFIHQLQIRENLAYNSLINYNPKGFFKLFKVDFTTFDIGYGIFSAFPNNVVSREVYSTNWFEKEVGILTDFK